MLLDFFVFCSNFIDGLFIYLLTVCMWRPFCKMCSLNGVCQGQMSPSCPVMCWQSVCVWVLSSILQSLPLITITQREFRGQVASKLHRCTSRP